MDYEVNQKYGTLLSPDIKIFRQYFEEFVQLMGIYVIYRSPKKDKQYSQYDQILSNFEQPMLIGVIFEEHPNQQTLRKIGWASELQENSSLIHVPYDLPGIQQGALFIIPSGLDDGKGRLFRVVKLTNSIVYPASITCEIVPEYYDNMSQDSTIHEHDSINLINEEPENNMTTYQP